ADVTEERAIGGKAWGSTIQNPAVFTLTSSQAILHRKRLPGIEGIFVDVETAVEAFPVNALSPSIINLLLWPPPAKVEPPFIEKRPKLVWPRHPDQHRRRVS